MIVLSILEKDCVELFVNEMLEIEPYKKQLFEKKNGLKPITVHNGYKKTAVAHVKKNIKQRRKKLNQLLKGLVI